MNSLKIFLRKLALLSPIALTKNIGYDRQSKKIIEKILSPDSNCIDIGCHKGEFLDIIIAAAPHGKHHGFEPIPEMYHQLKAKYGTKHHIHHLALSNRSGNVTFQHVENFPAYSGFRERNYDGKNVKINEITVETNLLDDVLSEDFPVKLIKIDVEGAEYEVLEGARKTLDRWNPFVIFEHGKGAAEHYGTTPKMIFELFESNNYSINTLNGWLKESDSLSYEMFNGYFNSGEEYYFLAYPKS